MKVYTKTGDKGTTALIGGKRVPKNHVRIEAYGTCDELISHIGFVRDHEISAHFKKLLTWIQEDLMVVSSILAADCDNCLDELPKLSKESIVKLESEIDKMEEELPPLRAFLIPGGHLAVSACHIARSVCRRAERTVLTLNEVAEVPEDVKQYFNRLSDYLFVLARSISSELNVDEIIWQPELQ
jgi:cob(I)alamin adenosyltransferase